MKSALHQELLGALIIILIAGAFMFFAADLRFGNAADMGPGYLPKILSTLLMLLGIAVGIKAFFVSSLKTVNWPSWRATIVIVACPIAFGILVPRSGLAIALFVTVLLSKFAQKQKWGLEVIVTAVGLSAFCCLIFATLLKMPVNIWP